MIKKEFFQFNKEWNRYTIFKNIITFHVELGYVYLMLNPWEAQDLGVDIINPTPEGTVFIYSDDAFKKQAELDFATEKEEEMFEEAYDRYYDKRWDEMPQIDLALDDWYRLKEKWEQIKKEQPEYVIFTLDDSGPLDKVEIFGKNELSQEDLDYIQQGHEKYLRYEKARRKYIQNHPDYSAVWRGPQDDEYEADIMKYYDDNE